ncbi:hypothetical protein [Paraburkholderia sp. BCC1885]|uniref:hypothetical protein n=1 Tax=Paraburkholderia sp. BCC1885 TaxID=2562669 RepID=UPI001183335F|nr:hypothetical protein [Paraburkholderia sp. BCC1885]
MNKDRLLAGAAIVVILGAVMFVCASCDQQPQPVAYAPQQQGQSPVMVAQQPANDNFLEDVFLYHMIFGGNQTTVVHQYSRPAYVAPPRSTTVVNNTTIINRAVPAPPYTAPTLRPTTTYTPPRATSYSGSYSPRPSYSSYSSRSSYSSGRR